MARRLACSASCIAAAALALQRQLEPRHLIDWDGPENGLLAAKCCIQFADRIIRIG
jgi:hypothetical protein